MRTKLAIKLHSLLERHLPERRLFLKSETDTRFIRLRPETQAIAALGGTAIVAWTIIATAVLLMDSIGAGSFRDQALRDQVTYQQRLNALSDERDARAAEAVAAQERFNAALEQVSIMQSDLLEAQNRVRELETGLDIVQATLGKTMKEREAARQQYAALKSDLDDDGVATGGGSGENETVALLTDALSRTAAERDQVVADAEDALVRADEMATEIRLMEEKNDMIFRQLEEAMSVSVKPLDKMFEAAGMDPDTIIGQVRRGYSGQGGPLTPLSFSTRGDDLGADAERANRILNQMDRLNLYRIAAQKAPFASPLKDPFRFTSGFGRRWGRLHAGTDFAAPHGTAIYATADGVVIHAGWQSGYGQLVKIKHEFGIETRYAHNSKLFVSEGQRVSRGQKIAAMGNTGRSTGTHLHYEVRVGGTPVNPMTYIKAANDVF
ncbi:Murein DD-endopeptidase MepM and murein hydrolase activator NlpD, contain LysM domain [Roseivivax halotolerans]|uniref:Murein DD-endopeptidase MepM and murein hydrolase activator NlpD, contain LysM domain n=1 Tax=Roseivivax halotolerans TaxID=93684 RepID=A0A1I5X0B7_9RHOB|nr:MULTISPECIES: M23 family metallopeptidase [Roseivivax]QFT63362.1 Murein DD-endopeptidase MepM [Roseivivax sp. THAF30]SFQ25364.1 Murein DD-endopeptidase MepM and murein hydrolase activator NlpD, contain LysM domain [Roseivivax halotolerans]